MTEASPVKRRSVSLADHAALAERVEALEKAFNSRFPSVEAFWTQPGDEKEDETGAE